MEREGKGNEKGETEKERDRERKTEREREEREHKVLCPYVPGVFWICTDRYLWSDSGYG